MATALLVLIMLPITSSLTGGWRSHSEAIWRYEAQESAQEAFAGVIDGQIRGGQRIGGLRHAIAACVSGDSPECTSGIAFLLAQPPNQVVAYRQKGTDLMRTVCYLDQPGCGLSVPQTGGEAVLRGVSLFSATREASGLFHLVLEAKGRPPAQGPAAIRLETEVRLANSY